MARRGLLVIFSVLVLLTGCGESPAGPGAADDGTVNEGAGTDEPTADDGGGADGAADDAGTDTGAVDGSSGDAGGDAMGFPEGDWYLVAAEGPDMQGLPLPDRDITLSGEGGELGGTAGCNSYSAPYALDGEDIAVREVVSSEMACEPAELMAAEQAYLGALERAERATLEGNELVLAGGDVTLRFATLELPTVPEGDGAA